MLYEDNYIKVLRSKSLFSGDEVKGYDIAKNPQISDIYIQNIHKNGNLDIVYSTLNGIYLLSNLSLDMFEKTKTQNADSIYNGHIEEIRCEENSNNIFYIERRDENLFLGRYEMKEKKKAFESKLNAPCNRVIRHGGFLILITKNFTRQDKKLRNETIFIYDMLNEYMAFKHNKANVIVHGVCPLKGEIYFVLPTTGEDNKTLFKIKDGSDQDKLDKFLRRTFFDLAFRFAENNNYDDLKPKISKAAGDNFYDKKNFEAAVESYIKTIDALGSSTKNTVSTFEPNAIIKKFLDISHAPYLIKYLEALHNHPNHLFNINHTSLLVYSFLKQKDLPGLRKWFMNMKSKDKNLIKIVVDACL